MSIYDKATRKATAYGQERSFELIGMQIDIITQKILSNDKLVKLLTRTSKQALTDKEPLNPKDRLKLIEEEYITLVPIIPKEEEVKSYIIISFDDFIPVEQTDKAMDYVMLLEIVCHKSLWIMDGLCPRPYLIMNELKKEFHMAKIDTWGPVKFAGASNLLMNDNYMGFTMVFKMSALDVVAPAEDDDYGR